MQMGAVCNPKPESHHSQSKHRCKKHKKCFENKSKDLSLRLATNKWSPQHFEALIYSTNTFQVPPEISEIIASFVKNPNFERSKDPNHRYDMYYRQSLYSLPLCPIWFSNEMSKGKTSYMDASIPRIKIGVFGTNFAFFTGNKTPFFLIKKMLRFSLFLKESNEKAYRTRRAFGEV